jgi:glycosyltransferase involved in cell wall biosynthesis
MLSRILSAFYNYTIAKKVLKSIDHYVCYTPYHRHILVNLGIDSSRMTVIPPGIRPLPQIAVRDFSERKYITYSGRFSEEKGVHLFLEVARRFKDTSIEFLMIGDGYLKEELQKKAQEEFLKVKFAGWIKDRKQYMDYINQTQVMIVPSLWPETFGMVILDAFQCGTPVIGTNMGGIPYIIEDNKNGFVVSPDPAKFAEKIKVLLDNRQLWRQFSDYGLACIAKTATWQDNAVKLQQLYAALLKQKLLGQ